MGRREAEEERRPGTLAVGNETVPLTELQSQIVSLLSRHRTEDSHLAGGAALHRDDASFRLSQDLDYFHDSEARVAEAFRKDRELLEKNGYDCQVELEQPGYVRCVVGRKGKFTKVEWAQDSSWRFMPAQKVDGVGYVLHPIDLAVNKLLALAGRDEPRDYLDVMHAHETILPLGALVWAACGKDPGFSPHSLLELLKRRGKYRPEDFSALHLSRKIDLQGFKTKWLKALAEAEAFIERAPPEHVGTLFYSKSSNRFVQPVFREGEDWTPHRGRPAGVLPLPKD